MKARLKNHGGESKRINAGAVTVNRSNITFNNLKITVRDREATCHGCSIPIEYRNDRIYVDYHKNLNQH
jgi:hypothetical protein